ncbi:hypothetical protein VTK73DRAFT_5243 [Phialemonium thermophilum]|uniref:Uncharacterized protein n=1 Tax=Phialemonium thermophilum TaxID=223376 RepID=A0ABR3WPG9_9PEZI
MVSIPRRCEFWHLSVLPESQPSRDFLHAGPAILSLPLSRLPHATDDGPVARNDAGPMHPVDNRHSTIATYWLFWVLVGGWACSTRYLWFLPVALDKCCSPLKQAWGRNGAEMQSPTPGQRSHPPPGFVDCSSLSAPHSEKARRSYNHRLRIHSLSNYRKWSVAEPCGLLYWAGKHV